MERKLMQPRHRRVGGPESRGKQRGVVLFVALIVMVALSLAGVALVRSVESTTMVAGNLTFRQSAVPVSMAAVEQAIVDIVEKPATGVPNLDVDTVSHNYYASRQPNEDTYGIPVALQGNLAAYPAAAQKIVDPGTGNTARYIIERVCLMSGQVAAPWNCDLMPPKQAPGTTTGKIIPIALPRVPFYRLTIRVDGPRATVAYSQATLR